MISWWDQILIMRASNIQKSKTFLMSEIFSRPRCSKIWTTLKTGLLPPQKLLTLKNIYKPTFWHKSQKYAMSSSNIIFVMWKSLNGSMYHLYLTHLATQKVPKHVPHVTLSRHHIIFLLHHHHLMPPTGLSHFHLSRVQCLFISREI